MVTNKEKKEMREIAKEEEDINSLSENSFDRDMETRPAYPSDEIPTDMYRYKRMRLVPDSSAEFQGLLDKDVVLANIQNKRPDPDYLRYIAETIDAMDGVFVKKKIVFKLNENNTKIPILNRDGKIVGYETEEIMVIDEEFNVIRTFLRCSFKADLTLSRAMGDQREAILDRTQNFGKEIKKTDNKNKYGG